MFPTIFNIFLEEIINNNLNGRRRVRIGVRGRIECIMFAEDKALLAED